MGTLRKKSKVQQKAEAKFVTAVQAFFQEQGATQNPRSCLGHPDLDLETKAGLLHIRIFDTWVAMRFEDVERAKEHVPHKFNHPGHMNPYSGKYNLHFGERGVRELDYCLGWLELHLSPVLIKKDER